MAKYSGGKASTMVPSKKSAPVRTGENVALTYEGDPGLYRKPKGELFVLAVNYMGEQENAFYESGLDRQSRYVELIHHVTKKDPTWMQGFIPFLRKEAYMRTASVVAACEYVAAGGPQGAAVLDSALQRADEPAEALGYWLLKYGRSIPFPVRKGLNRAMGRLYTEYAALKYDGGSRGVRMGDVIELTHPKPKEEWRSDLYRYLLDRRHHPTNVRVGLENLPEIKKWRELQEIDRDARRDYLRDNGPYALVDSGMTWETMSEWLPGFGDAESWEFIIDTMGYMALLRNLRNFDEGGVSDTAANRVIAKLIDPERVARSMQFPFRFLSAYKNTTSTRWTWALDRAMDLSTANIPKLPGRSLVLVDVSGSMSKLLSNSSSVMNYEAGAVFGVSQFISAGFQGSLVAFGTHSVNIRLSKGTSVLKGTEALVSVANLGTVGHGTNTWAALEEHYDGHDRVFIFTDMQSFAMNGNGKPALLESIKVPIYNWNLAGYRATNMSVGSENHYEMAGLSDVSFRQIALLESMQDSHWQWEEHAVL